MKRIALLLVLTHVLAGCQTTPPKVVTETKSVEVTKYVKQPIDPSLTTELKVDKPKAACSDGKRTLYCNGQLRTIILLQDAVIGQCNEDRKAVRGGQATEGDGDAPQH